MSSTNQTHDVYTDTYTNFSVLVSGINVFPLLIIDLVTNALYSI